MSYDVTPAKVWVCQVDDQPGALTRTLAQISAAGVDLDAAIVRPVAPLAGERVLFVAPIAPEQEAAARKLGYRPTESVYAIRVAGPDRPGLLADIARHLSECNIHIYGLSASSPRGRCAMYVRLECRADAEQALKILREKLKD
jgi:predicted amino acid-binding ACT domain protein